MTKIYDVIEEVGLVTRHGLERWYPANALGTCDYYRVLGNNWPSHPVVAELTVNVIAGTVDVSFNDHQWLPLHELQRFVRLAAEASGMGREPEILIGHKASQE